MEQQFQIAPYSGTPAALTWGVAVPSGVQTFRLKMSHAIANPNCVDFNSCPTYMTRSGISAISAPFGASGGKTLE